VLTGHAPFLIVPDVGAAWGMLEIQIRDLNGYVLGIGEPLES
jgi:hypothetical protein